MPTEDELTIAKIHEAFNERRYTDVADAYMPDAVITFPQSGERIVGRDNILGMQKAFPTPPRYSGSRIRSAGDLVVAEVEVDYGEGPPWKAILIYAMEGGHVASETAYFAAPFEAAEWRAPFREP